MTEEKKDCPKCFKTLIITKGWDGKPRYSCDHCKYYDVKFKVGTW